ncbi:MAG: formylglycine-generating enzyme family protein [Lentimicrobiaceae bacterium]|nr:formylglycine-generating enzyme family protein [Lentimicrobiaceae bacterium]
MSFCTIAVSFSSCKKEDAAVDGITFQVGGESFTMVQVKGGTFSMGTNDGGSDERPVHSVTLSDYSIGETEVTQALWQAVMGSNPSHFSGGNLPVEDVLRDDIQEFITKLNEITGKEFRLPTEAEWEYAARGGNKSAGYTYSGSNEAGDVAWCNIPNQSAQPVGTKQPNELGIYDMSGNVTEWCSDWYGYYNSEDQTNPMGPTSGFLRVSRGGNWCDFATNCRVTYRNYFMSKGSNSGIGFRLVLP